MKLRVREGAVIKVELMGMGQPFYKVGKVSKIFEDELLLIEQRKCGFGNKKTVGVQLVHINRDLIGCWEYANIDTIKDLDPRLPSDDKYTIYDDSGFCLGEGELLE